MRIPLIHGVIDRRILVNFRVAPEVLARVLPAPFRPKLVEGHGIAGICLIRLRNLRPRFLPPFMGFSSENAAHRIAVHWDDDGGPREGVYIPRRDTSSRFNSLVGGRLFPGLHHHARFEVSESADRYSVGMDSNDGKTRVVVVGHESDHLPSSSVFHSLQEASDFFERGSVGYSATSQPGAFDGLELRSYSWGVSPLAVERVESNFFSDQIWFPPGSVEFDCALLMRDIEHEWQAQDDLYCSIA